jgi:uncharacterized protein DUF2501
MNRPIWIKSLSIASLAAGFALVFAVNATAQDLGALKNAATGGGLNLGSLSPGSAGNAAGILQYCITNNYLSGETVSTTKDKLLGKIGGPDKAGTDGGYTSGMQGNVLGSDGNAVSLDGVDDKLKQQACQVVLDRASSLL